LLATPTAAAAEKGRDRLLHLQLQDQHGSEALHRKDLLWCSPFSFLFFSSFFSYKTDMEARLSLEKMFSGAPLFNNKQKKTYK
jgi:hypothetical protein